MTTALPVNKMTAPEYGSPQRDAIGSVVDGIVDDLCRKIGELRATLDKIEQAALQSAAGAKVSLNEHVGVCVRLNGELAKLKTVTDDIGEKMLRHEH